MRNIVFLSSVLCFVGCMVLLPASANADGYLVNTTFEADSAGAGTWQGDTPWGSNPDPVCGIQWDGADPNMVRVVTSDAYGGSQAGKVTRLGGDFGPSALLWFGHGENTRTLTMNWFQKYDHDSSISTNYAGVIIGDMSVGADPCSSNWDDRALAVLMRGDAYGTWDITVEATDSYQVLIAGEYAENTYYEFELVLDFQTKEYTAKARLAGSGPDWQGTVSGGFLNADQTKSFDYIQCKVSKVGASGYWDNITVSAECIGWLQGDLNTDCYVDIKDFALLANGWLECSNPDDLNCGNYLEE